MDLSWRIGPVDQPLWCRKLCAWMLLYHIIGHREKCYAHTEIASQGESKLHMSAHMAWPGFALANRVQTSSANLLVTPNQLERGATKKLYTRDLGSPKFEKK